MSATVVLAAIAIVGLAALLVLSLRGRGPMAAWCAAFAGVVLVWTTADAVHAVTGLPIWHALDVTTSPLTVPVGLHLALSFAGRTRALRAALVAAWVWFGGLSIAKAATIVGAPPLVPVMPWTAAFLGGTAAAAVLAAREIGRARRDAASPDERARAGLMLLALPLAAVFGMTDLVATFVPAVPELAPVGVLASAGATTLVALRWRLFGRDLSTAVGLQAAALGVIAAVACVITALALASSTAALVLVLAAVTAALVAGVRHLTTEAATQRARRDELARLGRASAQMAHDLKNPIAAVRAAADVLLEELGRWGETPAAGRAEAGPALPREQLAELAAGIRDDADRLVRLVDDYRRFVRIDVEPVAVDVTRWLALVVATAARAAPRGVRVAGRSDGAPADASFDPDLLAQVVDNLVRNAVEALDRSAGEIVIAIAAKPRGGKGGLEVRVEDDGPGMDAATRAQATDDFFTTKASGSGLGLAFARRVAEAHGGSLTLRSRPAGGTVVEVWLPAR